jgi:hypothetical protein
MVVKPQALCRIMAKQNLNKVKGHVQVLKVCVPLWEVMQSLTIQQISIGHIHDYKKPPLPVAAEAAFSTS